MTTRLRGVTWGNDRGARPLLDTNDAWNVVDPSTTVEWSIRPLSEFAHGSIERLANEYDLVVLDHPHIGQAVESGLLLPLERYVTDEVMTEQIASVGICHESYRWDGETWAFAIDAACHVAARRSDLVGYDELREAPNWSAVLSFAERSAGRSRAVGIPFIPVLAFMSFLTICANRGGLLFNTSASVVEREVGEFALDRLRSLLKHCHPESVEMNDVDVLEAMTTSDAIAYSPLLFGYCNYSRQDFRPRPVSFEAIPRGRRGSAGAILGGAGLAISARAQHPPAAFSYASWLASPDVQRTIYVDAGGQPGHGTAWHDATADRHVRGFFSRTCRTLERGYLRPRYPGYIAFQDAAGPLVQACCLGSRPIESTLDELDSLYRESLQPDGP